MTDPWKITHPEEESALGYSPEGESDLDWLAFLYISDELSESRREQFEARLAEDSLACAAVARAVGLAQAIAAAEENAAPTVSLVENAPRSHTWSKRLAWCSVSAAACLIAVLALEGFLADRFMAPQGTGSAGMSSRRLAEAWSRTLTDLASPAEEAGELSGSEELPLEDASLISPDWMLAGVVLEMGGDPGEDMPESQGEQSWE